MGLRKIGRRRALHLKAVIQGSVILAKAKGSAAAPGRKSRSSAALYRAPLPGARQEWIGRERPAALSKVVAGLKSGNSSSPVQPAPNDQRGEPKANGAAAESSDPAIQPCTILEGSPRAGLWTTLPTTYV
jgi:hypothetical protein